MLVADHTDTDEYQNTTAREEAVRQMARQDFDALGLEHRPDFQTALEVHSDDVEDVAPAAVAELGEDRAEEIYDAEWDAIEDEESAKSRKRY